MPRSRAREMETAMRKQPRTNSATARMALNGESATGRYQTSTWARPIFALVSSISSPAGESTSKPPNPRNAPRRTVRRMAQYLVNSQTASRIDANAQMVIHRPIIAAPTPAMMRPPRARLDTSLASMAAPADEIFLPASTSAAPATSHARSSTSRMVSPLLMRKVARDCLVRRAVGSVRSLSCSLARLARDALDTRIVSPLKKQGPREPLYAAADNRRKGLAQRIAEQPAAPHRVGSIHRQDSEHHGHRSRATPDRPHDDCEDDLRCDRCTLHGNLMQMQPLVRRRHRVHHPLSV
ncbi:hypothetical protein emb_1d0564 [Coriobacteriaceae bacterium EMTCatB1]|nr:hypothetical protein emb_1d0564 [Coriobacteriaceae bacterium EMTCatB1]